MLKKKIWNEQSFKYLAVLIAGVFQVEKETTEMPTPPFLVY